MFNCILSHASSVAIISFKNCILNSGSFSTDVGSPTRTIFECIPVKTICNISSDKIGGTNLAGKTYTIPGDYVKITMRTDSSGQYKGFSADILLKIVF